MVNMLAVKVKLCGKLPQRILLVLLYLKSLVNSGNVISFNIKAVQKKYMRCGDFDLDWTTICLKFITRALLILLSCYAFLSHFSHWKSTCDMSLSKLMCRVIIKCCCSMQAKTLLIVCGVFCE